ncbi:hypothetical protein [Mucilaginibacter sp. OK098]|uniref:hypothetical protein n=1 Tax=Mucilaginibacter sp. OK098 TaxID=1855297 RepID=UPI00091E9C9E|nr:hypothetical protein [Mucilaginibacter sp. OK098]SHM94274.1 hypothetical protein SAMN05216524_104211 [Mucilaginibacter sp. OK098]
MKKKTITLKRANFTTKNDICTLATTDMADIGTFFSQPDAKQRLDDYFNVTGYSRTDPKLIYGQLFGLNCFKTFMDKIDAYNTGLAAADQITGVRIYEAMCVRPSLPPPDDTRLLADVLIIPVLANGQDVPTIHDAIDPMLVLSDGMPCPNECKTGFYLK